MAPAESQQPTCPMCNRSDQVKTTQAAYDAGVSKCAPPAMPTKNIHMLPLIFPATIVVGLGVFLIVVLIGSGVNLGIMLWNSIDLGQLILVSIVLVCIVAALYTSFRAFQRVVEGDNEATELFPAWDRAMATWKSLWYCSRDNAVFDPKTQEALSDEELAALRSFNEHSVEVKSAAVASQ